jgi:peptidase E
VALASTRYFASGVEGGGVVMAGISAGAICWFENGLTDSFGMPYARSQ